MVRSRNEILEKIRQNLKTIKNFGVRRLGLFGSGARNEIGKESDLDFVVEFERKTFDAYMGLKFYLERLFQCPVDLVIADAIKPRLRPYILKEVIHAPGL